MLYGILLIFIFSCGQLNFAYRSLPRIGNPKSPQKNHSSFNKVTEGTKEEYPLHTAVCHNKPNWVENILAQDNLAHKGKKDDPDMLVNQRDKQGYLPIHWAVGKNFSKSILKALLEYPNSNQACRDGKTVLHWAVANSNLEAVKVILEHFKKNREKLIHLLQQKDNDSFTALHYAVDRDEKGNYTETDRKILQALLEYSGTHIDTQDNNGMTALHWAVANNNLETVEEILNHAKSTLKPEAYKEFIRMKTFTDPSTGQGACPAIYWTVTPECSNDQPSRTTSLKIFNLLLHIVPIHDAYGINYQDDQGYTMAHWAVVQGRNDIFKVIVEHKADLSLKDKKGRTVSDVLTQAITAALNQNNSLLIACLDSIDKQLSSLAPSKKGEQTNKRPISENKLPFKKKLHLEEFE